MVYKASNLPTSPPKHLDKKVDYLRNIIKMNWLIGLQDNSKTASVALQTEEMVK